MPILITELSLVIAPFAPLFTAPTWQNIQFLMMGALLCHGNRRISDVLRVMGLSHEKRFEKYHRVFNRAKWNSLSGGKILLGLLITLLPETSPILIVVDDTIERRSGKNIKAKGCYRDACRSTENNIVKCFGLKWVCMMLIVPLPWSSRPWALPFMSVLAPSEKSNIARGRKHKTCIDWTIILVRIISRYLKRHWVLIGDGGFACIRLGLACIQQSVTLVSRLRLDAALYNFPVMPNIDAPGRRPVKGSRATSLLTLSQDASQSWREVEIKWYGNQKKTISLLSDVHLWYTSGEKPLTIRWVLVKDPTTQKTEAFFSTESTLLPETLIEWFVLRWNIEVTFAEARAHLGMETQRQWSDKAIAKTTPSLMGLFSLTCLFAIALQKTRNLPILSTAWYQKRGEATFSDILSFVKRSIWAQGYFNDSGDEGKFIKIKQYQWDSLLDQLARVT